MMKKILLMAAFAVASLTANAQLWLGGSLSFDYEKIKGADGKVTFGLAPSIGYNLNDKWALGLEIGFKVANDGWGSNLAIAGQKYTMFNVAPYARYTFASVGAANFFVDGGVGVGYEKVGGDDGTAFHIGFRPGVAFNISDHVSFVGTTGYFGYRHAEDYNHFGLNVNNELASVGFFYTF